MHPPALSPGDHALRGLLQAVRRVPRPLLAAVLERDPETDPVAHLVRRLPNLPTNALRGRRLPVSAWETTVAGQRLRLYHPAGELPRSLLVLVPGTPIADYPLRFLAFHAHAQVLVTPSNLMVDDAVTLIRWVTSHTRQLGVDPARIALGGEGAGADLVAAVSLALRSDERRPALQVLLGPRTVPERGADLSGVPTTYVASAGTEAQRAPARRYAEAAREAGVQVTAIEHADLPRDYLPYAGLGGRFLEASRHAAYAVRNAML
ncbi:hypothetical protein JCM9957A_66380 [Kineosporia succinea]